MLPNRAYSEIPRLSPGGPTPRPQVETQATLLIASAPDDVDCFPATTFTRYPVHTTSEALRFIETARPRVVAIDWDAPAIDGAQVCGAARKFAHMGVLVTMASPKTAPAALKAGCHAILLKPFAPNLAAGRIGRLSRELPTGASPMRTSHLVQCGSNRVWAETHCPECAAPSATSFEFYSYRRMWYACLACDHVWLGPRQE